VSGTGEPTPTAPGAGTLLSGLGAPFVARSGWQAEPAVDWPVERAPVRAVVVHHTATDDDDADLLATVRRIQRFHARVRGWGDIGYSFVILRDGRVAEGREGSAALPAPHIAQGGHALGHNPGTVGIALAGRFHDRLPTDAAWASLVDLVATIARNGGVDPLAGPVVLANGRSLPAAISGHRHACETSCPGDALAAALGDLRAAVADRMRRTSSPSGPDAAQNAG
jgi:hypothetical protein